MATLWVLETLIVFNVFVNKKIKNNNTYFTNNDLQTSGLMDFNHIAFDLNYLLKCVK